MSENGKLRREIEMETVIPKVSFTGYPDGKTAQRFQAGVETEVPKVYAYILRQKGLINERPIRKHSPDKSDE